MKNKINMIIHNINSNITKFLLCALLLVFSYIPLILVAEQSPTSTQPPPYSNKKDLTKNNNLNTAETNRNFSLTNDNEANTNSAYDNQGYNDDLTEVISQGSSLYQNFNNDTYTPPAYEEAITIHNRETTRNRSYNLLHSNITIFNNIKLVIAVVCISLIIVVILVMDIIFILVKK